MFVWARAVTPGVESSAVQALRQHDTRWGLNWKRGRAGDMLIGETCHKLAAAVIPLIP
jgi:hypothetical protein